MFSHKGSMYEDSTKNPFTPNVNIYHTCFIILSLSDFLSFSLPQYFSVYFLKNKKIILYNYSIIFKTGKLTWTV